MRSYRKRLDKLEKFINDKTDRTDPKLVKPISEVLKRMIDTESGGLLKVLSIDGDGKYVRERIYVQFIINVEVIEQQREA